MRNLGLMFAAGLLAASTGWAEDQGEPAVKALPAAPVEEAIKLAKSGVGEEVQIAWAETRDPYAAIDADTILKLKAGGVGEKVIAALVRHGGQAQAAETRYVRVIRRYDTSSERPMAETVREARREYTTEDAVRYTYTQPSTVVYSDSYAYPSYAYYGYPSYYSPYSYYSYPYYSRYCYPSFSFRFGGGHYHGGHYHGGYHGRHCR